VDWFTALEHDPDHARLRQYAASSVPDAELDRVRQLVHDHPYRLTNLTDLQVRGDRAQATAHLQYPDGSMLARTVALERQGDQWRILDPEAPEGA
jgi:hypothetical protein